MKTLIHAQSVRLHFFRLCTLGLAFGLSEIHAATYYVATTGNNSNIGSQQAPWSTIAYAASRTIAGDTVRVQPGTYSEAVTETTDGTSGSPITFVADGAVTITGAVNLNGSDYVRLIGFAFNRNFSGSGGSDAVQLSGTTGCEIWNCTFRAYLRSGVFINSSSGNIVIGNTFFGTYGTAGSSGESAHIATFGNDNLVAYNTYNQCNEDFMTYAGNRNRFLNNYGFNPNVNSAAHVDFLQTGGHTLGGNYNVLEASFYLDSDIPADHHHFTNLESNGYGFNNYLSRRNVVHQTGTGIQAVFQDFSNVYFVNESYIEAERHSSQSGNATGLYTSSSVVNPRVFNSIFFETWGSSVTAPQVYELDGSGVAADYNLAWDREGGSPRWSAPFTSQAHRLTADPRFVNYSANDYRVNSGSAAIAAGGPLTTVTSATGAGTTFSVSDAGFFRGDNTTISQYGGNLVSGDKITVGVTPLTINSINGNSITTTSSFAWLNGDRVYLGWETIPTIGAYPANHIPLTAATYARAGNDYVVTPNGDTRFVVFFVDGVPSFVDNSPPYVATIPTGTVTMRAYPLYASKILSVIASPDSQPRPLPPSNLRTNSSQ